MLQRIKQSKLYPLYFLVHFPFLLPRLMATEGVGGALRWSFLRFQMLLLRFLDRSPDYYEKPVREFRSRLGFSLFHRAEFLIYEEIFLERCYDFGGFADLINKNAPTVLDFGTHHGLFIDFVRTLNPACKVHGAEMSPRAFAVAAKRHARNPHVHINNLAIGGSSRSVRVGAGVVSVEQSLYVDQNENGFEIAVVTPVEFLERSRLSPEQIEIIKWTSKARNGRCFRSRIALFPCCEM